jgi:3,4-dihydroxy 2-butanone 4-phosphate synthase/GTP cyclohydrolase II
MNEDGTMARLPDLIKISERFDLKIVSIEDLISYRLKHESSIERHLNVKMPTKAGDFDLVA